MDFLASLVSQANGFIWGLYCLIPLLCGTGLYFSFRLGFVQVRRFFLAWKQVFGGITLFGDKADKHRGMSSFQSLATAVAGQVGTGNLAGAATAVALGGPGAIFWMWTAAFFGMATIYAEAVLAQHFRVHDEKNGVVGGPAYYISQGLHSRFLAGFFALALIIALGFIGNMVQSNSIADAFANAFGVNRAVMGGLVGAICVYIFMGGTGRIASMTEKVVPVMALFYIIGSLYILVRFGSQVLPAFRMIFVGAFDPSAATGGLVGASVKEAVRYGVARGLFSNEAGMGSTPHAHAVARVDHPAQQGMAAFVGVFMDAVIVTLTALVILVTGVLDGKTSGITLTQNAFSIGLGSCGLPFVAVCMFFFAFSTIVGWYYFGSLNVKYLFGQKGLMPYRVIAVAFVVCGALLKVDLVWDLADFFNGVMVFPNLIALIALAGIVVKSASDYEAKR